MGWSEQAGRVLFMPVRKTGSFTLSTYRTGNSIDLTAGKLPSDVKPPR